MPFDRPVQIGNVESGGQCDAAVMLDPRDDIVWRGCAVGAGAMLVKFEFFAMGGYGLYVWGSYAMALACMAIEPVLAMQRHRAARRALVDEGSAP